MTTGKFLSTARRRPGHLGDDQGPGERPCSGIELVDADVTNIPMIEADPYGKFIPGPAAACPRYVTAGGLVEGNRTTPVRRARRTRSASAPPSSTTSRTAPTPARSRPRRRPTPTPPPAAASTPVAGRPVRQRAARPARHLRRRSLQREHRAPGGPPDVPRRARPAHRRHQEHPHHRHDDRRRSASGRVAGWRSGADGLERRAPLPGRPLRDRDAVPAPRVRGVRPQGAARDQPVRALRLHPDRRRTRPSRPSSPTPSTASATRC